MIVFIKDKADNINYYINHLIALGEDLVSEIVHQTEHTKLNTAIVPYHQKLFLGVQLVNRPSVCQFWETTAIDNTGDNVK